MRYRNSPIAATIRSDSAIETAIGGWRPANQAVRARIAEGSTILTAKARPTRFRCSDLRCMNRSRPNATMPIATASRAVPGIWPDDSEA